MDTNKTPEQRGFVKVDTYKSYDVYSDPGMPKENVAMMIPNSDNKPTAIIIHPEAYKILQTRPDYLERIYAHEVQEHTTAEGVAHGSPEDREILEFLRDNSYDFGSFTF
ncbi:MAG: hypothetical protein ACD_72C00244G0001 [uncultured bacterium]|nr:MAG: hypothetical protein ACD_72C00244G0001 [uncultured bacterium]